MDVATFVHAYHARAPRVMWFLGAGASAAGNIKTAWHMTWDFKRRLYCGAQGASLNRVGDIGDPLVRERLQSYFDRTGAFPPAGADEEYGAYFEALFPEEPDRRDYIERLVAGGRPSHGHRVLGALLHIEKARVVWTTNFDSLVEDAFAAITGAQSPLVVATPDTSDIARRVLNEARAPLLVKLHGDYRSERLMNTRDELREQEQRLEAALVDGCRRHGLAVVGYSGRDTSVMRALEKGIDGGAGYPDGLFWFYRADAPPSAAVQDLIARARAAQVRAHLIAIETFDELLDDAFRLAENVPPALAARLVRGDERVSDAPMPATVERGEPVVRLNALPLVRVPSVCRLVPCKIGGVRAVHEAVAASGADILAARRRRGVIVFGRDADAVGAFARFGVDPLDVHAIEPHRLGFDSPEHGLLAAALARALGRDRPVRVLRRRTGYQLIVVPPIPGGPPHPLLEPIQRITRTLTGLVPRTPLTWTEAAWMRLDFRLGRPWLLFEPTVWVSRSEPETPERAAANDFVRNRLADRYNATVNGLFDAWAGLITAGADSATLAAFGLATGEAGIDACFTIARRTAFSRRGGVAAVAPVAVRVPGAVAAPGVHASARARQGATR